MATTAPTLRKVARPLVQDGFWREDAATAPRAVLMDDGVWYAVTDSVFTLVSSDIPRECIAEIVDDAVIVDGVAYDHDPSTDIYGLAWHCPACGVGGTESDGDLAHNRYAHAATVTLETFHYGEGDTAEDVQVYVLHLDNRWGGDHDLAQRAAAMYPGTTFAMVDDMTTCTYAVSRY